MRIRLFLTAMLLGLLTPLAHAQEDAVRTIPFEGVEIFRHILHHDGARALTFIGEATEPWDTVLIVFGKPEVRITENSAAHVPVSHFVKEGGNVLVATDSGDGMRDVPVRFFNTPIVQPFKDLAYRRDRQCPWLYYTEPNNADAENARAHPLFRFLQKKIATNCPSQVEIAAGLPTLRSLLAFPNSVAGSHSREAHASYMIGSPKDAPPEGRQLYIAGQGMFMNGMMLQADNDNFAFAINAIRWLREGPDGTTRSKVLFIVDGAIVGNFDAKLTPPPLVPMPTVKMADRLLRGLENERFFHRLLNDLLGEHREQLIAILFTLGTFVLLLYGAKKFMEGRYLLETSVPRMVGPDAVVAAAAPQVEQRQAALFRQADLGKEACLLARAWMRQEFGIAPEQWSAELPAKFHVGGFLWGRHWEQQADFVLRLAHSGSVVRREGEAPAEPVAAVRQEPRPPMPAPIAVTRREFAALLRTLPILSQAVQAGRLALLIDGKSVR